MIFRFLSIGVLCLLNFFSNNFQIVEQVVVEYVPEKAELEDGMDDEFRKIFEKFSFQDSAGAEV